MKSIVVGTAGHIDHGKTALVRALTGIDTDRLEEEKRRGISIELGFAHTQLSPNLRIALIDVPGHEKFIKNMLAGVGGIDVVMLVVAADESIMPQTREHFEICRLLGIRHGLVAVTKADLVDSDILQLVRMEIEDFLAGSLLEGSPIVPVSAVTGQGLPELRTALEDVAEHVSPRSTAQHFRMPVDRVFLMQGFGTVATGTVTAGSLKSDDEVEVIPGHVRLRVRGIQVHGAAVEQARVGERAAINLAGSAERELVRGAVLAAPGRYRPTTVIDCTLELLPSAKPLKNRAPVHFHAGTAETIAEVRTAGKLEPGDAAAVRLVLRDPVLLVPGDRFVIRMFSPVVTIGGGEVVDAQPPRRAPAERTMKLRAAGPGDRAALLVAEAPEGVSVPELSIRMGLAKPPRPPSVIAIPGSPEWFIDEARVKALHELWRKELAGHHKANPLQPGIRREELRSRTMPAAPPFVFESVLASADGIAGTGEFVHLKTHKIAFKQEEEEALVKIEAAFERAGLEVPGIKPVLESSGVDAARARTLLQILFRERRLVRVAEDLVYHPSALVQVRGLLAGKKGARFSVPEFKDWTGISRKYAIPLLEYFDREKVTRREGDARVVL